MFIDYAKIELAAGDGGAGAVSFRREKFIPKGGPDGGDGGQGGNIVFKVNNQLNTLQDFKYRSNYQAEKGQQGRSGLKTGRNGRDIVIPVPVGTVIKDCNNGRLVADMVIDREELIICRGGKGGRGNVHFKSPTNQAPRYAQPGLAGESGSFEIELKVLADVGLVGLPNAGKSTLISVLSSAKPKIADYPFTTLEPNLGIVKYGNYQSFVMADIPGLIEGASEGKGLGHKFLKHVERTGILVFLIDGTADKPRQVYEILNNELLRHNPDMHLKKQIIVRTKMDIVNSSSDRDPWLEFDREYLEISAVTNRGLGVLINSITKILNGN